MALSIHSTLFILHVYAVSGSTWRTGAQPGVLGRKRPPGFKHPSPSQKLCLFHWLPYKSTIWEPLPYNPVQFFLHNKRYNRRKIQITDGGLHNTWCFVDRLAEHFTLHKEARKPIIGPLAATCRRSFKTAFTREMPRPHRCQLPLAIL